MSSINLVNFPLHINPFFLHSDFLTSDFAWALRKLSDVTVATSHFPASATNLRQKMDGMKVRLG